jgi:hypothetical protein
MVEIEEREDSIAVIVKEDEIQKSRYRAEMIQIQIDRSRIGDFSEQLRDSLDQNPVPLSREHHTSTWIDRETAEWILDNI